VSAVLDFKKWFQNVSRPFVPADTVRLVVKTRYQFFAFSEKRMEKQYTKKVKLLFILFSAKSQNHICQYLTIPDRQPGNHCG
jgi:hypothetical protein